MDTTDLIASFATTASYPVTRRAAASLAGGIATPGSTTTVTIIAAEQPASARDLQRLPELRRTGETRVLFTTTKLLAGGQGQANEADLVGKADGSFWEVQMVDYFQSLDPGEGYYRCIVQAAYPQGPG